MKKHASKEAFIQRLQELAEVKKPMLKDNTRNLGTLIDYKRAADGIAYGIVKEQHHYYIKKAGTKQDPNVADFAYIGGLSNVTEYQYNKLAEADKQRNMIFNTINEGLTNKPDKNGSKKKRLNEDVAKQELDQAEEKVGQLDAATSAESTPEPEAKLGGGAPADAGMPAPPAEDTGMPTDSAEPAPDAGTEELPAEDSEELPPAEDTEPAPEGDEEGTKDEIKSEIGKMGEKILNKTLNDEQVNSYVKMFLGYFKENFKSMPIEDRKQLADEGILEVETEKNIEDLEANTPNEPIAPETGIEEEQCAECGGFGKYAESRGYDSPDKFMECDDEEKTSVVSDYVTAGSEGMNDGDEKTISLIIKLSPDMLAKLKDDYGHEEYAEKIQPQVDSMNEASEEDLKLQLNELWGGLGALGKAAGSAIGGGIKKAGSAIGGAAKSASQAIGGAAKDMYQAGADKVGQAKQAIGQAATGIKQAYNAGEINPEVKKLESVAADLGKQIAALNKRMVGAGQQPVNVKSILATIQNQLGAGGQANLSKLRTAESVDPSNTEVTVPNMLKEEEEEEVQDEKEFDVNDLDTDTEETGEEDAEEVDAEEIGGEETGEEEMDVEVPEETPEVPEEKPEISFAPAGQTLGAGVVKPSGAGVEIKIEPDKTVTLNMNESEKKLRKYVRMRLEEKAGLRKPTLNESKKSPTLKKLDATIDKQFKLYESALKKKVK